MKTPLPNFKITVFFLALTCLFLSPVVNSQSYKTASSGDWNHVDTWQFGTIPPSDIPAGASVVINHEVTFNISGSIINKGTISIFPISAIPARLIVPGGINFENSNTGTMYLMNASYLQYRFVGGGNSGVPQSGTFTNKGGIINSTNSYIEVAQDWISENGGKRVFNNSCLLTGQNYTLSTSGSIDSIINTKIVIGWHGSGNFSTNDATIYFQDSKINLANGGNFSLNSGAAYGRIKNISLRHPLTGVVNGGNIFISGSVNNSPELLLDVYCVESASNYIPNGKVGNTPAWDCSVSSNFTDCTPPAGITTLAVKLFSFGAALSNNNKVDLQWVTASEIGAIQFIVEKSSDGANFKEIAVVFSMGNTISKTYYNYTDKLEPSVSGIFYYRIRAVEDDGNVQFSATRIIRVDKQTVTNITILAYPNPVTNELQITIPDSWQNKKLTYEMFRANGLPVSIAFSMKSSQTETINVSGLAPGLYFIRVSGEGESIQQKIVKL